MCWCVYTLEPGEIGIRRVRRIGQVEDDRARKISSRGILGVASEEDRLACVIAFDEGGWRRYLWEGYAVAAGLNVRVVQIRSVVPGVRNSILIAVTSDAVVVSDVKRIDAFVGRLT